MGRGAALSPDADDLIRAADLCWETLAPFGGADWTVPAGGIEWTCRQTLEHLCSLAYAPQLATS
jgi:hypothetical protein